MPKRDPKPTVVPVPNHVPVPSAPLVIASDGPPRLTRPYTYYGVEFFKRDSKEWVGVCPFCDKPKFHVDSEGGQSDCKVCHWEEQFKDDGITGNHYGFIKYLWRVSYDATKLIDYSWLSAHRKLSAESLRDWGICKSVTTGEWLVPAYGVKDPPNIIQVYKYVNTRGKHELLPTPGFAEGESHGILLPRVYNPQSDKIYVSEGVWDAVALYDSVRTNGGKDTSCGVIAVPGCGIFKKDWVKYTVGRDVVFLFDNDHPNTNQKTKVVTQPALSGVRRASGIVYNGDPSTRANSVSWLDWGINGKGYDPELPDGYDVRDWLMKDSKPINRLLELVQPVPKAWIAPPATAALSNVPGSDWKAPANPKEDGDGRTVERLKLLPCKSWKELTDAFRLACKWTPELNGALAVGLSCVSSVRGVGEPLWCRMISPPSTYKSQLCKALGTNYQYTIMDDGMNGFYSGMNSGDGVDHSLVTKWFDKCMITKEGSTLFTNSRSEEIIGEARAIYDGEIDRRWKNGIHCNHRGWRGTWLLAGTPSMKDYDNNELGPRFIDYTIVKEITDELEDDILMRAMNEQAGNGIVVPGDSESTDSPDYVRAKQLCGGYVDYLRHGVDTNSIPLPTVSNSVLLKIAMLSKFIERMRGRPSKNAGSESVDRALPARVAKQLVKLSRFLCVVMGKQSIDQSVMDIVCKVAIDTSSGWTQEMVSALMDASRDGDEGLEPATLARRCGKDLKEIAGLLLYLPKIGVLEMYSPTNMPSPVRQARLRLTDSFRTLYSQVRNINR